MTLCFSPAHAFLAARAAAASKEHAQNIEKLQLSTDTARHTACRIIPRLSTFLFNYVQLGLVIGVVHELPNNKPAVLILVSFEAGILADCFLRGRSMLFWVSMALLASLLLASPLQVQPANLYTIWPMVGAALLAMSLKKIRTSTDALGSVKRRWRALGYLSAGAFVPIIAVCFVALLFILVLYTRLSRQFDAPLSERFRLDRVRIGAYLIVMLHHFHYFSYAYMIIAFLFYRYGVPPLALGPLFYVGWIGYYLFIHVSRHEKALVVGGHVLASLAVFTMLVSGSMIELLLLWLLTGVGGGTIILFREAETRDKIVVYERFKTWEAIGHVLGLICLAVAIFFEWPALPFFASTISGLACAVAASFFLQKEVRSNAL